MKKISLFIIFLIRVISGIVIFRQGWEKFTGDFTLNGLVPVIRDNTDSPQWYKWFFEHIVAHTTGLFNIIVPLGEMAIGLGLILYWLRYHLKKSSLILETVITEVKISMTHLLIVDDEKDIVDICQTYFEYEGYQVTTTTCGKEALKVLSSDIDIMILDIMMPEVNGYDIVKKMKDMQLDIPFIYLTAKTQEHDTIYALTLGADDYIKKPFSPRELVLRTNNLLARLSKSNYSNKIEQLEFDGLVLKNLSKTLTINNIEIPMRIKEFELLWYLASREGEVISKSELLEKVWGYDYYEDANTVNVHIHRIREKLEKHDFLPYTITTVWGLGYKFERSR